MYRIIVQIFVKTCINLKSEKVSNTILKRSIMLTHARVQQQLAQQVQQFLHSLPRTLYPYPHCTKQNVVLRKSLKLYLQCQYLLTMTWGVRGLLFLTLLILNVHWRRVPQRRRLISFLIFLSICNLCNLLCQENLRVGKSPAKYLCVAFCIVFEKKQCYNVCAQVSWVTAA